MKLSLVMIVKNEEQYIRKCIQHAKKHVDEIIVADTGSTDRTKAILAKLPVTVVDIPWKGHFAEARNIALSYATGDWILMLDADEMITHFEEEAIQTFMQTPRIGRIRIKSKFRENEADQEAVSYVSRLFPRGLQYTGRIHEQINSDIEREIVPIHVNHSGYYKTDKSGRNIPLLLQALLENPDDPYYHYQLAREYKKCGHCRQSLHHYSLFFHSCDPREAYAKEGIVGYLHTLTEEKEYNRALEVIQKSEPDMGGYPDFHFAAGLFYTEYAQQDVEGRIGYLMDIEKSYRTCLAIGDEHPYGGVKGTGTFLAAYNLALYYELMDGFLPKGREKAQEMYEMAAKRKYEPAIRRLSLIKKG